MARVINNYPNAPTDFEPNYQIPSIPVAERFNDAQYTELCLTIARLKKIIRHLNQIKNHPYIWKEIRNVIHGEISRLSIELELRIKVREEQWKLLRTRYIVTWVLLGTACFLVGLALVGAILRNKFPDTDVFAIKALQYSAPIFGVLGLVVSRITYRFLPR